MQKVIADSPSHSARSSSPNLHDSKAVMTIEEAEQDEMSGANQQDESSSLSQSTQKSLLEGALNAEVPIVRCRNETA